jgi:LCP family protein required for cell wall assembly
MANRRNDPYGQDDYYDDGYYDDGYYDQDGYYDDGGYYDQDGYYDEGYSDGGGYYDDGYYDQDDYYAAPSKPSMAARASGKANPDPYRRSSQSGQPRRTQRQSQSQYYETSPQPRRRKKKRHPFRKLLLVLLILAAILAGLYFLLFQAPEQTNDGLHTRKDGFYNILICATDEEELRTDTIMIASLDQENGTVSLTSLPRDTIVDNGQAVPKLNGVYGLAGGGEAGAEALMDQVETLLGFRPDGYAVINYQIFKDVVDAMGGVTFDVPMDMTVDNANDPDDVLEIAAGEQVLDGTMALGVCRYRYGYLMADIQRQYVQQSFLKAMIQQLMSPKKLLKLPAVYSSAMDNIVTDLSGANIRYLCLHVLLSGMNDIQQNTLPGEAVTYNGASCYGLYGQSVVDLVNQVMNPYEEPITLDDVHMLTVSGGTLVESTWSGTAFDASTYQYD